MDEKAAKRQLLAALDPEFYREVITPMRLDTELAKMALEEIFAHVLEVWWCAHPNGLERAVRDVSALLESLAGVGHDAEPDPPSTRDSDSRQRGGGGVRFPPSKWRDERNHKPGGKFALYKTAAHMLCRRRSSRSAPCALGICTTPLGALLSKSLSDRRPTTCAARQ
ncbi:hypothetical protein CYMTET_55659 [Cymbomonas tetramitiformis]|uniref:Uncharacterized protein n=1 Tax=Cymbomonas tetramitiformis TaxID=36881 RepID=A0AAE0BDR7_9CHLO|nr:hypothetical protein CYMTET_55659 [Cymbomonas tetramitiformis]